MEMGENQIQNSNRPLIEMIDVSKAYFGKRVVEKFSMKVYPGEIVALIGENGAGKSTIKNILVGLLEPDEGEIFFKGQDRKDVGMGLHTIAAVHQELSVLPSLSVAENVCMPDLRGKQPFVDWNETKDLAQKFLDMIDVHLDLDSPVETLSPGERQLVEIAKALRQEPGLLILDEPTTSLSMPERQRLFTVMRTLQNQDVGIIFITHFIDEVYEISNRTIIIRNRVCVGDKPTKELSINELEGLLVGRALHQRKLDIGTPGKETALKIINFNSDAFVDIDFEVKYGEIVGIAGLMGAGRTEIVESIFGLRKTKGELVCLGESFSKWNPTMLRDMGVLFVPEDRKTRGIFPTRALRENLTITNLKNCTNPIIPGIGFRGEKESAITLAEKHRIAYSNIEESITSLSGGNQQKSIVARWLSMDPKICIFDDPTRGVDIGAKEEISALIAELAKRGNAIVLVESDINELIELSHRIIILRKGKIVAELKRGEFDTKKIISIAATSA
jgi:ABC-type sugar transport system ATPase subunit